jgi:hypothetical protein
MKKSRFTEEQVIYALAVATSDSSLLPHSLCASFQPQQDRRRAIRK